MTSADPPAPLTLFCLHHLGGSARAWAAVAATLPEAIRCVAIDLPGFGEAADLPGFSVSEMADAACRTIRTIRATAPGRWMLAGHSMGAKIACVLARRAEDVGKAPEAIVLLAGSPPAPEPMDEAKRRAMLGWLAGDAGLARAEAEAYVDQNVGETLDAAARAGAIEDVLRADPAAWRAWLEHGSREDWAARVGVLRTPALIVSGERDAALGRVAQRRLMAPHFARAELVTLPGAGHLLPLERPLEVALLIAGQA